MAEVAQEVAMLFITANIASRILATKGILQPDEVIHPSFWSFHYWTDMKGSNLNDIVNDELRKNREA